MKHDLTAVLIIGQLEKRLNNILKIVRSVLLEGEWINLIVVFSGENASKDEKQFKGIFGEPTPRLLTLCCKDNDPGTARFTGSQFVSTSWTVFWDDDDEPLVKELQDLIRVANPQRVLVGQYYTQHNGDIDMHERSYTSRQAELMLDTGLWRMLIPTDVLLTLHPFASRLGEDKVMLANLLLRGVQFDFVDRPIYIYRKGHDSLTKNPNFLDGLKSAQAIVSIISKSKSSKQDLIILFFSIIATILKRVQLHSTLMSLRLLFLLLSKYPLQVPIALFHYIQLQISKKIHSHEL